MQNGADAAPQQSKGGLGGLFGGRSKAAADAPTGPQQQKKIDAKLVDAKPVGKEVSPAMCPGHPQSIWSMLSPMALSWYFVNQTK